MKYRLHHTATMRGYVSRKCHDGIKKPYDGKFGRGYIIVRPRWDTTRYCYVSYYVETEE